jgi:IS30 family transposase
MQLTEKNKIEIARMIRAGKSSTEVCEALGVKVRTVHKYANYSEKDFAKKEKAKVDKWKKELVECKSKEYVLKQKYTELKLNLY